MQKYDVIVIGAGAAGLLAAGRAGSMGARVLILEKMERPGRKLLITGKGRCNITNDADLKEFITHVHPTGNFLKPAFSRFFNKDLIAFLNGEGLTTVLERGKRYFPASGNSADVLDSIMKWVKAQGADFHYNEPVEHLLVNGDVVRGVKTSKSEYSADKVILATGGKSYPATGSSGDGYKIAMQAGHTLIHPRPALVPLETRDKIPSEINDLILKNVRIAVWIDGRKSGDTFGEIGFHSRGLTGPGILTVSRDVVSALDQGSEVQISLDLKPALDDQQFDKRLLRELNKAGNKSVIHLFRSLLPSSVIPYVMKRTNVDRSLRCDQLTAKKRKRIRREIKNMVFNINGYRPFKEAIITAGGIPTKEITAKTMESKIVNGLFFAGEILDLDGDTGGYNLQIAFSTGWLAGQSAVSVLSKA